MRPACEGDTPVQVKNLYIRDAPGNLITETRDMCKVCSVTVSTYCDSLCGKSLTVNSFQGILTGIDLNSNITVLDIKSTSKLGQQGFLGKVRAVPPNQTCASFTFWFCDC
jgi:hypothetical protein